MQAPKFASHSSMKPRTLILLDHRQRTTQPKSPVHYNHPNVSQCERLEELLAADILDDAWHKWGAGQAASAGSVAGSTV